MISLKTFKRVAILLVGGTVLVLGVALVVLPGPAFIVIPAGLAILAIEFEWARHWLRKARRLLPNKNSTTHVKHENKEHQPSKGEDHPSKREVARRAYELCQVRGGEPGHEIEDWRHAEQKVNKHGQVIYSEG
jgi:hypothetical protein